MAVKHESKRLLHKLNKRIKTLQKKEEKARQKLQAALKKIHHLAREYKIKLALKTRVMENKIAKSRRISYSKIIDELEDMMIRKIRAPAKRKPRKKRAKVKKKRR